MQEFKIRCSAISDIMSGNVGLTEPQELKYCELYERKNAGTKPLTANMEKELSILIYKKANPELPTGAKTYLKTWLKQFLFERNKDWKIAVVEKGLICEQEGIDLVSKVYNFENMFKNEKFFNNDFMQGTPDIIINETVRDIKNSWDLFTFPMFDDELPKKEYWWQLQGYMCLTGIKKAALDYVLIDIPQALVDLDLKKLYFQSGGIAEDWTPEKYQELYRNYRFDDIPEDKRVKTFSFDYEEGIDLKIKERVLMCRKYLNEITVGN